MRRSLERRGIHLAVGSHDINHERTGVRGCAEIDDQGHDREADQKGTEAMTE